MSRHLDTNRIEHLLNPDQTHDLTVTVAGLGSGGAPVVQYLTMCGIRRWRLFDPDTLEAVNLVKHPARRADLGRLKVDILREWILDRNPEAEVEVWAKDVRRGPELEQAALESDLVLCAVDTGIVREFINDTCVRTHTPCLTGSVFRQGFGGEVFAYLPGFTGCYRCMQAVSEAAGFSLDTYDQLSPQEEHQIYGLGNESFRLSGLAVDIGMIATLHAQMALALLVGKRNTPIPRMSFNWLSFSNRPHEPVFANAFEARRIFLKPQKTCPIACSESVPPIDREKLRYYDDLGLVPGANDDRIKKAHKRLAQRYHPDRAAARGEADAERFRSVQQAFEALSAGGPA